jgi:hypothetical protein
MQGSVKALSNLGNTSTSNNIYLLETSVVHTTQERFGRRVTLEDELEDIHFFSK